MPWGPFGPIQAGRQRRVKGLIFRPSRSTGRPDKPHVRKGKPHPIGPSAATASTTNALILDLIMPPVQAAPNGHSAHARRPDHGKSCCALSHSTNCYRSDASNRQPKHGARNTGNGPGSRERYLKGFGGVVQKVLFLGYIQS